MDVKFDGCRQKQCDLRSMMRKSWRAKTSSETVELSGEWPDVGSNVILENLLVLYQVINGGGEIL